MIDGGIADGGLSWVEVAAAVTAITAFLGALGAAVRWVVIQTRRNSDRPREQIDYWRDELGVVDLEKKLEEERRLRERDQRANTRRFLKHMPWDQRAEDALRQLGHDIGSPPPLLPSDGDEGWQEHAPRD